MKPSMDMGTEALKSKAIKGEARKDSLTGKNEVKEYRTSSGGDKSRLGGHNKR